MLTATRRADAPVLHLPGRDWFLLLGPETTPARNATLGYSRFPGGSAPSGHVHDHEEELIYVVAGSGWLVSPDARVRLEPGVAVHVEPGTHHATMADDGPDLEMITVFSPPVTPGSYEAKPRASEPAADD